MKQKIKLVIVENDPEISSDLCNMLEFYNVFDLIKTFSNVNEANDYIGVNEVDAVFIKGQIYLQNGRHITDQGEYRL